VSPYFPRSFTMGADLLRRLRMLAPGEALDVTRIELCDIEVPGSPLDHQTPEYIVDWMNARLPFYCEVNKPVLGDKFTFLRPNRSASQ
jgi:hypothetical protein